jgi:hypothetical protein
MADNVDAASAQQAKLIEEDVDVVRHCLKIVPLVGLITVTKATWINCIDPTSRVLQKRNHEPPSIPTLGPPRDKQNRLSLARDNVM